jgi:predicted metal-dependent HD superfamily phosphohydrolase
MTAFADDTSGALEAAWLGLLAPFEVGGEAGRNAFLDLAGRYAAPGRAYHNLNHLREVLAVIDALRAAARDATAVRLAAWFHDAVYDPRAADNEEKSARLAEEVLGGLGLPERTVREVGRLVLLTRTHEAAADDADGHVLLDSDLAILAAPPPRYDEYARAIRQEYGWVPEEEYRAGRRRVLDGFLRRGRLYRTEQMFRACEPPARANLRREIDALRMGPG